MTQDYQGQPAPPTPVLPDELIQLWWNDGVSPWSHYNLARCTATWTQAMTTLAEREQAAADVELEACCAWLEDTDCDDPQETARRLRAARRPKPPTLAEKGLAALVACSVPLGARYIESPHGITILSVGREDALLIRDAINQLYPPDATATTETGHD